MSDVKETDVIHTTTGEEGKDHGVKYILSKYEYDLYKIEDDLILPIVRIKHINLPGGGDRWKIFSENKVSFIVEGSKLNKKERTFLQGLDGINFLIREFKKGIKSWHALKTELKKVMKRP